jgi:hypothetical protein
VRGLIVIQLNLLVIKISKKAKNIKIQNLKEKIVSKEE